MRELCAPADRKEEGKKPADPRATSLIIVPVHQHRTSETRREHEVVTHRPLSSLLSVSQCDDRRIGEGNASR